VPELSQEEQLESAQGCEQEGEGLDAGAASDRYREPGKEQNGQPKEGKYAAVPFGRGGVRRELPESGGGENEGDDSKD